MGSRSEHAGPPLGAHMSIAGGLHRAVERARSVEATALQIFVKSARQWKARDLDDGEVHAFRSAVEEAGLGEALVAHATYLLNIASPKTEIRERSILALADEVDRCARLGVPYLVLHPGSHDGAGPDAGIARVAEGLERIYAPGAGSAARRRVRILIENTAGQGNTLGRTFEELAAILDRCRFERYVGVCFDTCHALAAGYEFRDRASYRSLFQRFDEVLGVERLNVFHLNDSKHPLGSRKDRHEHIGRGHVGLEAFRLLVNDRRFRRRPMVLETPKRDDLEEDRMNLGVLRSLIGA